MFPAACNGMMTKKLLVKALLQELKKNLNLPHKSLDLSMLEEFARAAPDTRIVAVPR